MNCSRTFYSISLPCALNKRRTRLAIAGTTGPLLYYWRRDATDTKREFVKNGFKKAKVVKVRATFRW